jgi:hypothetical protein
MSSPTYNLGGSSLSEYVHRQYATLLRLGLCCFGIVIAIIIVGKIPYKWWHGGVEAPADDDDDPYYRTM